MKKIAIQKYKPLLQKAINHFWKTRARQKKGKKKSSSSKKSDSGETPSEAESAPVQVVRIPVELVSKAHLEPELDIVVARRQSAESIR